MLNKNLRIRDFETLMLKDYTATKITIYFATKKAADGYDPFEGNLTTSNLNPKTIRGYIHATTAEQNLYKGYGVDNNGVLEILVDSKYYNWFKIANKIVIDSVDYQVFNSNAGNDSKSPSITKRAFKMIKIVLMRND